jgi:NADH-quinone oxidoreductase subunit L
MLELLWLIPLTYFASAAVNGLLGPRAPRAVVNAVSLGGPAVGLVLALGALVQYLNGVSPAPFEQILYRWSAIPALPIDVAFLLDPLSAVMLFVVTFVGFLIHIYSAGYMAHDGGYQRYFAYLNLFMGMMLLLVLGNNFLVSFVGWEGVGLCSYLLIGFYYDQDEPPRAGRKAFIVNRIGDFAFLLGVFALASTFGSLSYRQIFGRIAEQPDLVTGPYALGLSLAAFAALCLFVGAVGKSAQIPLYVWLPDAMAGPTPVSALIHAATMVTAGVYIVVRSNVLFQLAPGIGLLVAVIGAATALFAATIGLAQNDIKKVLAYSTVSQLGYMFLAAGLGAYIAAIFHVVTHAFFKALLFLGSGSVIHAMSGEQDMRSMGGLRRALPITYRTYLVAALAIAGIPPLAGFFSKDEILAAAAGGGHWGLWGIGFLTAGLTAFYMFRSVFMTFHGDFRGTADQEHHLHESPATMTVPLLVLAVGSVVAGWIGIPKVMTGGKDLNFFHHFLEPVVAPVASHGGPGEHGAAAHHLSTGTEWVLILLSVAVAVAGILLARRLYDGRGTAADDAAAKRFAGAWTLLSNKYYVDELYDRAVVRPLWALSRGFARVVDGWIIEGLLRTGTFLTELAGDFGRFSTTGNVRNYALYFFVGVLILFWWILA